VALVSPCGTSTGGAEGGAAVDGITEGERHEPTVKR